jgi:MFS superfamily sulfate permease-like transporter
MGLFKLGFITILLSDSLVSGYTAAAAFTIMITQIKFLFGLPRDQAAIPSGPAFVTPKVRKPINVGYFTFLTHCLCLSCQIKKICTWRGGGGGGGVMECVKTSKNFRRSEYFWWQNIKYLIFVARLICAQKLSFVGKGHRRKILTTVIYGIPLIC